MKRWILTGVIILVSFSLIVPKGSSTIMMQPTVPVKATRVPTGAVDFDLSTTDSVERFVLTDFNPDQSYVGRYNVGIECLVFLSYYSEQHERDVVVRNLWDAADSPNVMSTGEGFHKMFTYTYSQPTENDPDFSIQLELTEGIEVSDEHPIQGWFLMRVVDEGVTEEPAGFTMPVHVDPNDITPGETSITGTTGTDTTETTTTETTTTGSKEQVPFGSSMTVLLSLIILLFWKRTKMMT